MSIITKGLGTPNLSLKDYDTWRRVVKKVIGVISRTIPKRRKRCDFIFQFYGDMVHRFEMEVPIEGEKDFRKTLWLLLEDED